MFNNNEIGTEEDPDLIYPITRIHNDGKETSFKLLGVQFDEYLSFDDHIIYKSGARKSRSRCSAPIDFKIIFPVFS